jgi:hypothetical protein
MCVLAVWRLTHLLAREDGPEDLIVRLRARLGDRVWGRAMDCFYCLSVWIALPFALLLPGSWLDRALGWLALSGAACLLEKITSPRGEERKLEEVTHVLWSKESHDGEPDGVPVQSRADGGNSRR